MPIFVKANGIWEELSSGDMSPADIKTSYESNANTNAFTDALLTKLNGIAAGAQVNASVWASQPIGVPIPLLDNLTGVSAPPTNNPDYRYIKLTASDSYNTGVLTGESISGTAPNLTAVATVNLPGSPLHGVVVPLINTDRRFVRAGSSGTKEQSQNLAHTHTVNGAVANSHDAWNGGNSVGIKYLSVSNNTTSSNGGNEARPANIGATYYMRIK